MNKNTLWTVLAVIGAILIAWVMVDFVFKLVWVIGKLLVVAVVAVVVYFVLRMLMRSAD